MVCLPSVVLARLNFRNALRAETEWQWDILPSPAVDHWASIYLNETAEYIGRIAETDFSTGPADVLLANKWKHGRRAVAMMSLSERVIYRAVVDVMASDLPEMQRSEEDFARFKNAPLEVRGGEHIVTTDIANFYSSIPVDSLANLLIQRSGQVEESRWLSTFWRRISGRSTGVPQVNESSDRICEAYALELERRVAGRGVKSFRYADDFRLVGSSGKEAVEALEIFDEEARTLGLFVNERKTFAQGVDEYRRMLKGTSDPNAIIQEVRESLRGFDDYSMETIEPHEAEVLRGAARKMLSLWKENQRPWTGAGERLEAAKLAKKAFAVLTQLLDDDALSVCQAVIESDPQNTPSVARYLKALLQDRNRRAWRTAREIIDVMPLSKWQRYWMLDVFADCPHHLDERQTDWIISQAGRDQPEVLRSYACWVLGTNDLLEAGVWRGAASGGLTALGSPAMSGALGFCEDMSGREKRQLVPAGFLDRGIFKWVSEGRPPF